MGIMGQRGKKREGGKEGRRGKGERRGKEIFIGLARAGVSSAKTWTLLYTNPLPEVRFRPIQK